jgi:NAD(P)-dependent dehydrogenase (short-subunit alcohol dehydrogenase family)
MKEKVIVTGAADSVGRVIASKYVADEHQVFICDVNKDALDSTLEELPSINGQVANVGNVDEAADLIQSAVKVMGGVTVLINVVGISGPTAGVEEISDEEWDQTLQVNVSGMFYLTKRVVPLMKKEKHGAIVNFSSASTRVALPMRTPYVTSKAAVEGFTRTLARELGPFNIRCNAILPGMINNQRMQNIMERLAKRAEKTVEEVEESLLKYVSMRTKIEPEEIADTVLFLTSPAARHITGQLIGVDGNLEWEE